MDYVVTQPSDWDPVDRCRQRSIAACLKSTGTDVSRVISYSKNEKLHVFLAHNVYIYVSYVYGVNLYVQ